MKLRPVHEHVLLQCVLLKLYSLESGLSILCLCFCIQAAFGVGLNSSLLGTNPGTVTGGQKASLTAETLGYVEQIAQNEIDHVAFLREALGDAAIDIPDIDIGSLPLPYTKLFADIIPSQSISSQFMGICGH